MPKRKLNDEVGWYAAEIANACIAEPDDSVERLIPEPLSPEQFREEMIARLKKISYPYQLQSLRRGEESTYQKLQRCGNVEIFLNALLGPLKAWSETPEFPPMHSAVHPPGELGRQFRQIHRSLARELNRHTLALQRLNAECKQVPTWVMSYSTRVYNHLINELALLRMYTHERPPSEKATERKTVERIFEIVTNALHASNIQNDALGYHLTSIFCSSNCRKTGTLQPTPGSVRKFLERKPNKRRRK